MKRGAGLLLVVLTSVVLWAQTPDCPSLTQQALDLSGVNQQIEMIGKTFASHEFIDQISADKPDGAEFAAVFRPILVKNFDSVTLKKDLLRKVEARCKAEEMNQAIQQMQTPLVARMLQLEASIYTPEGQEKVKKYMRIVQIAPPPDSQMEAADIFDQKVGFTDDNVDIVLAFTRGMYIGAGAPDDVIAQLQDRRNLLRAQMQGNVLASILLTYSSVTRADLTKYSDELSSGPLKSFHQLVQRSFVEILEQRAEAVGRDVKAASLAKRASAE